MYDTYHNMTITFLNCKKNLIKHITMLKMKNLFILRRFIENPYDTNSNEEIVKYTYSYNKK